MVDTEGISWDKEFFHNLGKVPEFFDNPEAFLRCRDLLYLKSLYAACESQSVFRTNIRLDQVKMTHPIDSLAAVEKAGERASKLCEEWETADTLQRLYEASGILNSGGGGIKGFEHEKPDGTKEYFIQDGNGRIAALLWFAAWQNKPLDQVTNLSMHIVSANTYTFMLHKTVLACMDRAIMRHVWPLVLCGKVAMLSSSVGKSAAVASKG